MAGTTQAINGDAPDTSPLTLLWKKHFVPMILSGKKTATRRRARPTVKVGGTYHIKDGFFDHLPERIRVDRLFMQRLGDMTEEDAWREGPKCLRDFVAEWEELMGSWSPDEVVWVVEFHLVDPSGSD